ncbi:Uncharacterised protein [Mycobacteroides abscessus subsp. abscessus]|nr:Uncharacterised protein [Mycobacteroides abscessus subsp. abscessus]
MLSTISGMPAACAISDRPAMSRMSFCGLEIDSANSALVSGVMALRHDSRSSGSSTKVVEMPSRGSV